MLSYQHSYHAGGPADVHKHAALCLLLVHLNAKPKPYSIIDLYAGEGAYALDTPEAQKTAEFRQGIARLAPGLTIEARAPDGIIEAVSVKGAKTFAIGVQWHPEYKAASNPDSVKLFDAFGDAVRKHAAQRSALRLARAS